jgi:hypothetical protein
MFKFARVRHTSVSASVLLQKAEELVAAAKSDLSSDATDEAVEKADKALELVLKDTCVQNGCTDQNVLDNKPFSKWGLTQYVKYLSDNDKISKKEKANFFQFHDWRNPSQHSGLIIHPKQARLVVDSVEAYLKKQRTEYLTSAGSTLAKIDESSIDEKNDVAPIFRATPGLIENGLQLSSAEKYLGDSLKHIDLHLHDPSGVEVFVEVEWNAFSQSQLDEYTILIDSFNPNARIVWLIPSDLQVKLPQRVQQTTYDRTLITHLISARRMAKEVIIQILKILSTPCTPPPSIMYQMKYQFPNIMSACYFDAEVETDKGKKEIGLRKQAVGRYLDLVKSLCQSRFANESPELLLITLQEILVVPYYLEMRGGVGKVVEGGFAKDMQEKKSHSAYKQASQIVSDIVELTSSYLKNHLSVILEVYKSPELSDLLYRIFKDLPQGAFEMGDRMVVKRMIEKVIREFSISQTPPIARLRHSILNKDVENVVQTGYENDMARRIIEIAVLKRVLFPHFGVNLVQVLTRETFRGKEQYARVKCQNFRLNTNTERVLRYG